VTLLAVSVTATYISGECIVRLNKSETYNW